METDLDRAKAHLKIFAKSADRIERYIKNENADLVVGSSVPTGLTINDLRRARELLAELKD